LAKFGGDKIYAFTRSNDGLKLATFNAETQAAESSISIPAASDFFAANGGFVLQTADSQVLYTTDGVTSRIVLFGSTVIGLTPDKQQIVAVRTPPVANASKELVVYSLHNKKTKKIAGDIINSPVMNSQGLVLYTAEAASTARGTMAIAVYDAQAGKHYNWELKKPADSLNSSTLRVGSILGTTSGVLLNESGAYVVSGT
jgi:hypothetical protein